MENLTRKTSKKPAQIMTMCKKHPKHRQSVGVCSICLREKLSKLPSTSSSRPTTIANASSSSSSSSSSSLSSLSSQCSSNASSYASPMHDRKRGGRVGLEEGKGYLLSSFLKSNKNIVLTKSRSMATYVEDHGMIKKKKSGFWSKFIRSKSSNKRMIMGEGG